MNSVSGASRSTTSVSGFGSDDSGSSDDNSLSDSGSTLSSNDSTSSNESSSSSRDPSLEEAQRVASTNGSSSTAEGTTDSQFSDLNPLSGPLGMAARREFNGAPLNPNNAFSAYQGKTADHFAGPDDMRLDQLNRSVAKQNSALVETLDELAGPNTTVSGRAKTPFSTFGKLRETAGSTIGDIKDLSGARLDINPTQAGFADVNTAQSKVADLLGENFTVKKDYIQNPNDWGYTGRIHSNLVEASGLTHEVQIGPQDLSKFIDQDLTTASGQKISLHDATGYKGQIHGVELPKDLAQEYSTQMRNITDVNASGKPIADVPQVEQKVKQYVSAVEEALPDSISKPAPQLSTTARIGNAASKGFGVLGIAGSATQTANGISTIASGGDKIEGVADVSAGTTGLASGAALMSGRVALGTTTGGAVAVIDGARDIYTGVRDGDVEKTAVGSVKAGAGTAMIAGVATANPVLIAGGALAYGGAVVYESRDVIASAAKSAWNWATSW